MITNHAVAISAPASAIWPWLVQIGPGRGGAYTYDWIENLLGLDMYSAEQIIPELQKFEVGDAFALGASSHPPQDETFRRRTCTNSAPKFVSARRAPSRLARAAGWC